VPGQDGIRLHDAGHVLQHLLIQLLPDLGERLAFAITEAYPAFDLRAKASRGLKSLRTIAGLINDCETPRVFCANRLRRVRTVRGVRSVGWAASRRPGSPNAAAVETPPPDQGQIVRDQTAVTRSAPVSRRHPQGGPPTAATTGPGGCARAGHTPRCGSVLRPKRPMSSSAESST
jgi:hypothetical protein